MTDRLPLSVILATIEPWPDLANCLDVLGPQVAAVGGEIIVGDGHGAGLDATKADGSGLISWVRLPGASVFELRARAVERARGEIVALTEDHCIVGQDWCRQFLEAFDANPDAMAVAGPVLNGSVDHLIDWANFLHTFGGSFPPLEKAQLGRVPPPANVAFRRRAIESAGGQLAAGRIEFEISPRLFRDRLFHVDERLTVTHVQSHGVWYTLRSHFDNGRTTTGLSPVRLSRRQLPWAALRVALRSMSPGARRLPRVRASVPFMFLLSCCHAAGEVAGIVAGPGRSPMRVR